MMMKQSVLPNVLSNRIMGSEQPRVERSVLDARQWEPCEDKMYGSERKEFTSRMRWAALLISEILKLEWGRGS